MTIRAEVEGIGTLEFPDGTDPSVIQATVKRVVARGAPQIPSDTKILGRQREPEEIPRPNMLEEYGRGFMDLGQRPKQAYLEATDPAAAKEYTRSVDEEVRNYVAGRGKNAGPDFMRFAGGVTAGLPAAATIAYMAPEAAGATILGRAGIAATQGAAQGASEYVPEGGSAAKNTVIGTVGGVAGSPAAELLSRALAKVAQAGQRGVSRLTVSDNDIMRAIDGELRQVGVDWKALGADVKDALMQQARRQLSVSGELSPDQLARKLEMDEVLGPGAGATQAQVTRDPRQWTRERNLQKTEPAFMRDGEVGLTTRYQDQVTRLKQRLNDAIDERRAKSQNEVQVGQAATAAIQQKMDESKRLVDDLYSVWRESGNGGIEVKPQRIADELGRVTDEYGVENIPTAVRARLETFGMLGGKQTKLMTIDEAEKLRRFIGNNMNNDGKTPDRVLTQLKRAVDDAVMDTDAPDIPSLQAAREAARSRFAVRDQGAGVTAAAEDAESDKFFQRYVLNGNVRELQGLKTTLNTGVTGAKPTPGMVDYEPIGAQAWRDVQAQTLRHIMEKAQTGPDGFSGKAMSKALKEIGDERLKVLFDPDQIAALRKLERVSNNVLTEPEFSAVNRSNTTPTAMQYMGDVLKKLASVSVLKPVALPLVGAYEKGAESLERQGMRKAVNSALTGVPVNEAAGDERYARLVKLIAGRMTPLVGDATAASLLYPTQQR